MLYAGFRHYTEASSLLRCWNSPHHAPDFARAHNLARHAAALLLHAISRDAATSAAAPTTSPPEEPLGIPALRTHLEVELGLALTAQALAARSPAASQPRRLDSTLPQARLSSAESSITPPRPASGEAITIPKVDSNGLCSDVLSKALEALAHGAVGILRAATEKPPPPQHRERFSLLAERAADAVGLVNCFDAQVRNSWEREGKETIGKRKHAAEMARSLRFVLFSCLLALCK